MMLLGPILFAIPAQAASPDPVIGDLATEERVEDINRKWRGLGIGYDNGLFGSRFAQGVKVDVPFGPRVGQFFGLRVRGLMVHGELEDSWDPIFGGGAEIFGRGPVMLGILRVYGGGGVYVGNRLESGEDLRVGAGGHFGLESVLADRVSLTIEVGGQGGFDAEQQSSGASVMAGVMVYLGGLGN